MREYLCFSGFG
ncbi:hypothetical protein LINPERPRIM_LOCUS36951 [Linum perenne]